MKISCVNLSLLDWSLSSVLLVDIWLPVAHPGEAEGRSQSEAVGVGGRWDSSLQISTLFTCFLNDRTVGQTNEELSHRKLLWMCLFCVFSEWLYPLQYAYMKSSWLTTVLFISFQSAPERDQRAGDPVPDRALLQGERWGTGSQSMSVNYWTLFPFLSFSSAPESSDLYLIWFFPRWPKRTKSWRERARCCCHSSLNYLKTCLMWPLTLRLMVTRWMVTRWMVTRWMVPEGAAARRCCCLRVKPRSQVSWHYPWYENSYFEIRMGKNRK